MKSLRPLINLQKAKVDEQRILLGKLVEQLTSVEGQLAALEKESLAQKEWIRAYPEDALTYGAYIQKTHTHRKLLERKLKTARQAVDIAREALAVLFEEQKRYEITQKRREEEAAREMAAREVRDMDEKGSVAFERRARARRTGRA